ncbi:MAG TPA: FHA domain-containing protein [Thermoanaerobaculia bacterium]
MADKRCENGHFIDESWDICPYCPQDASEPEIPIVRPSRFVTNDGSQAAPASAPAAAAAVKEAPPAAPAAPAPVAPPAPPAARPASEDASASLRRAAGGEGSPMERTVAVGRGEGAPVQARRYVVGWLVGLNSAIRGESYPVRMGRNVIGRDRRSDIVINDDQASSHHADLVFRPEERRFILMDHNSTNGTYVNEAEIEPRRDLAAKDMIRIGSHKFIFFPLCGEGFHWDDEGPLK